YNQPATFDVTVQVPIFLCPSRRSPPQIAILAEQVATGRSGALGDYAVSASDNTNDYDTDQAKGAMIRGFRTGTQWNSRTRFQSITDGLSNTFFIGEKHVQQGLFGNTNGDRTLWNGDTADVFSRAAGPGLPIVSNLNQATNQRFGSYHPGI